MTAGGLRARVRVGHGDGFRLAAELDVPPGRTAAVMGPSGAGKSTLLAALAGILSVDDGEIALDGTVLSSRRTHVPAARRGTVLLGQRPLLFPHLSVLENVAFGVRAAGARAAVARAEATRWLADVGLADAGPRRPDELSGGQQQRVAVARALAVSPRLLLLDEPFTSLDPVTARDLRTMLVPHLAARTCVVVTHDAGDGAALADDLVIVEDGRVTQQGALPDVLAEPRTDFVAALTDRVRVVGVADERGRCVVDGVGFVGDAAGAVPTGAAAVAVFRIADVRVVGVDGPPAGATTWTTRVERVERTVDGIRLWTTTPGIGADIVSGIAWAPGVEVALYVAPDAVRILPV